MSPELTDGEIPPETQTWQEGATWFARPFGELNLYTNPDLKTRLIEALELEGLDKIAVDLSHASFVDSTFFGTMVGALKKGRSLGIQVGLVGMNDRNIRKVFEIQGLDRVFPYFDEEVTDDIAAIQDWAQTHNARPILKGYQYSNSRELKFLFGDAPLDEYSLEISWAQFSRRFGKQHMVYQPVPPKGTNTPFYSFFKPEDKS